MLPRVRGNVAVVGVPSKQTVTRSPHLERVELDERPYVSFRRNIYNTCCQVTSVLFDGSSPFRKQIPLTADTEKWGGCPDKDVTTTNTLDIPLGA